ncbi:MAG: hypothetical protein EA383_08425 [Spirochaetaceae bacterium]|nr:MAG: hypothetical protein EA383_08425 [Spirochaetaceae bacterium]
MPSHISHLLFAEDACDKTIPALTRHQNSDVRASFILGAQGPDLFLHNRRRRPSGLHYGIVLHRKGSGTFCASLLDYIGTDPASGNESAEQTLIVAYLAGYLTHIVLDRVFHPYINVHAGWPVPGKPETYGYHMNHVFLERIIDTYLALRLRDTHPRDIPLQTEIQLTPAAMKSLLRALSHAVARSTRKGRRDPRLARKLVNAYSDSSAYYAAVNRPDIHEARARIEQSPGAIPGWLRLFHPLHLPPDVDLANEANHPWRNPCTGEIMSSRSVPDLYAHALAEAQVVLHALQSARFGGLPVYSDSYRSTDHPGDPLPESGEHDDSFEALVGNGDLSDERREGEPCRKTHMDVMDFSSILHHASRSIIDASEESAQRGHPQAY